MRYGLTIGEFAKMANQQEKLDAQLTVVPCKGWDRRWIFPDYGNVWVPPTMGIPSFETALLYPGTCLFESTNLSEGRGTTAPFKIIGAPFIDAQLLADEMNAKRLDGVVFRPVYFIPTTSKFSGEQCGGVQIHVTNARKERSVTVGIELLYEIRRMYGENFEFCHRTTAAHAVLRSCLAAITKSIIRTFQKMRFCISISRKAKPLYK